MSENTSPLLDAQAQPQPDAVTPTTACQASTCACETEAKADTCACEAEASTCACETEAKADTCACEAEASTCACETEAKAETCACETEAKAETCACETQTEANAEACACEAQTETAESNSFAASVARIRSLSQADIVMQLEAIAEGQITTDRFTLEQYRTHFYRLVEEERKAAREAFLANGGQEGDFSIEVSDLEADYKELMGKIRQQRARAAEASAAERQANWARKQAILEALQQLVSDANAEQAELNFDRCKELQAEWKSIGPIPSEEVTSSWKSYQHYIEQFYDLVRLNHEMRTYDLQKNLEAKTALCEQAEALAQSADVVEAYRQLQLLHDSYRETGPVAKELRAEVWARFKDASTLINKRHQDHFLRIKQEEEDNLAQKTALCEQVESLELSAVRTRAEWQALAQRVIDLQAEWKNVGFAPRKHNQAIYERFRAACDHFFATKSATQKAQREALSAHIAAKKALCEQAEALAERTDWESAAKHARALQSEWKSSGHVPAPQGEELWTRFNQACKAFFDRKKAADSATHAAEKENLALKQALLTRLEALVGSPVETLRESVKALQDEWKSIGRVPRRQKDSLNQTYRELCDQLYGTLHEEAGRRRVNRLADRVAQSGGNELQRLQNIYQQKKAELQTYETNFNFLSTKSKQGNSLVQEIERRLETLRSDLALLSAKIKEVQQQG